LKHTLNVSAGCVCLEHLLPGKASEPELWFKINTNCL